MILDKIFDSSRQTDGIFNLARLKIVLDFHDETVEESQDSAADVLELATDKEECDEEKNGDGVAQNEEEVTMDDAISASLTHQPIVVGV